MISEFMAKSNKKLQKIYDEVQEILDEEDVPISIISKDKLKVYYEDYTENSKSEIVTRNDVNNFSLNPGSGFASLGKIDGDWREIQAIVDSCEAVFDMIDKKMNNNK
jgi:hypothetical protein